MSSYLVFNIVVGDSVVDDTLKNSISYISAYNFHIISGACLGLGAAMV